MKNRIYYTALLLVVLLTGCYRDDLCFDHPEGAQIELKIDWSRSALHPNAATALIYRDNQLFQTEVISVHPPVSKIIQLPVGTYSILVFDEMEQDYANSLSFTNKEAWELFELKSIDDPFSQRGGRAPSDPYKSQVDTLAVDRVINFEVTPEMIDRVHIHPTPKEEASLRKSVAATINFTPKRVFTIADIVLKVKNGRGYYFTATTPPYVHGTAESYFPAGNKYSTYPVAHSVNFIQVPSLFNTESSSDITWAATLHVIGLTDFNDPDIPIGAMDYILTLPFQAAGGVKKQIDVDLVREAKEFVHNPENPNDPTNNWDDVYIEVELELPLLVEVGGFQPDIEDWTEVDIPLDGPTSVQFMSNNGSNEFFRWPSQPGITINLPAPLFTPVDGLSFKYWSTHPDGTEPVYYSGQEYETKRGGATFYAVWEVDNLPAQTLTFYANDGTNEKITSRQKPGVLLPMPQSIFRAPPGKTFKHWNTSPNGTGTAYRPDDKFRVRKQDDQFYAIWQ